MKLENKKGEYLMALVDLTSVTTGSIGTNTNFIVEENKVLKRISQSSLLKTSAISTTQVNSTTNVPSSSLVYSMNQSINKLNSDTLKFFGSGQIIDANQYPDLSLLPNGIFLYNGWSDKAYSGDMLPPFKGAWGIWIRKTQYGLTTDNDGADVVISENGDIFTKPKSNNDWICLNDEIHSILNGPNNASISIDTLKTSGAYSFDPNTQGTFPFETKEYGLIFVRTANNGRWVFQDLICTNTEALVHYIRKNINNQGWSKWYEYAGTQVS